MNKLFTSLVLACFMLLGMRTSAQISQPLSNGYIRTNLNPVRFLVNTPSGLAGLKRASLATWGGQAVPSIMNAPVVRGLDSLAALPLTNGSAISGKVCLLFRGGSITFAQKAQYAYQAGAIAVIIVNNVDGEPIVMGNTGTATYTTMPIVMIKNTDGIALNNALISSTPVAVSIGSWSLATHDLGLLPAFQSAPHALSIPYSQLSAGAGRLPYRNFVGGAVGNFGTSAETGISVTDSVTWTPTSGSSSIVHTGSYTVPNMAANDSVRFGFGDATSPWSLNVPASTGNYTYKYDLKFSNTDAIPQDNTLSFTQYVTDSIFCKGSYDYKLMQPLVSQGIQPSGITNAFSMGPLFYMAKGKYAARKIQYSVSKNTVPTLDQEEAVALLYKWVDGLNGQPLDSFVEGDELRLVGINRKTFTTADSVGKVFTVPVFDPSSVTKTVSLDSNAWYWVSVQASNNCFIGVDYSASFFTRSYIQSKLLNNLEMPELLWSDDYANLGGSGTALAPFPFGGNAYDIDSTFFDRFYSIPALAFHISKNQIGAVLPGVGIPSEEITIGSMVIAPVPANDVVQVSLSLSKSSNVAVRLLDVTGKIVSRLDVLSMKMVVLNLTAAMLRQVTITWLSLLMMVIWCKRCQSAIRDYFSSIKGRLPAALLYFCFMFPEFDIIVVGGGHAGCEAAAAAGKMGSSVLLISMNLQLLGTMSCNPAVGGIGKGQIVREIDALGGLTGIISDKSLIQFRMLNRSKGPGMWSPRTQNDRQLFSQYWREALESIPNVSFWQDTVKSLVVSRGTVTGVITVMGQIINSKAVILTNGTFLNGKIHIGRKQFDGGRIGERKATGITEQLIELGFQSERLKTGTPPRVDGRSLNYSKMEIQEGDEDISGFSFLEIKKPKKQRCCWITHTNDKVHEELKKGFLDSPMYSGNIKGTGPRYCPSVEDKISRFANKDQHQLFIEPEGWNTIEIYVNGFSTSLPEDVQLNALRKVSGFENCKFFRPGYAIEYDFFQPTQLKTTLETRIINNLYFAGQINGTTGYEEAACQGLMAGINASNKTKEKDSFILNRDEAYIGVLIDDLINKGTEEPYRMFTSRAEYRTLLRQDNADLRLTRKSGDIGLADYERVQNLSNKEASISTINEILSDLKIEPGEINEYLVSKNSAPINEKISISRLVLRPNLSINDLMNANERVHITLKSFQKIELEQAEIQLKYGTYIQKEKDLAIKMKTLEELSIPSNFNYSSITALSIEARQKLAEIKPQTLGQASRISGVNPTDVQIIMINIGR